VPPRPFQISDIKARLSILRLKIGGNLCNHDAFNDSWRITYVREKWGRFEWICGVRKS
jgi:hypothetical protein